MKTLALITLALITLVACGSSGTELCPRGNGGWDAVPGGVTCCDPPQGDPDPVFADPGATCCNDGTENTCPDALANLIGLAACCADQYYQE